MKMHPQHLFFLLLTLGVLSGCRANHADVATSDQQSAFLKYVKLDAFEVKFNVQDNDLVADALPLGEVQLTCSEVSRFGGSGKTVETTTIANVSKTDPSLIKLSTSASIFLDYSELSRSSTGCSVNIRLKYPQGSSVSGKPRGAGSVVLFAVGNFGLFNNVARQLEQNLNGGTSVINLMKNSDGVARHSHFIFPNGTQSQLNIALDYKADLLDTSLQSELLF